MNPDKLIKYSIPFFAFAIVTRAIVEISFIYYLVPVMCLLFIVLLFISSKFNGTKNLEADPSTSIRMTNPKEDTIRHSESSIQYPESSDKHASSPPKAEFASLNIFSARGGFRFAQHHPLTILLLPGLWFLLTALWSAYPEISAHRALYFILISAGCISAGILWMRYNEKGVFYFLLPANIFIVLLSLFSILTNIPADSWTGGHGKGFMGFFGHQNLLASVILFTLPGVIFKLRNKDRVNGNQLLVNRNHTSNTNYFLLTTRYLLLIANLLVLALTYSRASILSLVFGAIVFLILNKNWNVISYSFGILILFFLIVYLTPSFNQFADKIIKKDFPEIYSSRIWMWEPSYRAAIEGGLTGLGYGISDPKEKVGGIGDHYEDERFIREKGNSVLALIEETGVIGFVLFSLPILYLLFNIRFTMSGVNKFNVQGLSIKEKNLELRTLNPEQKYIKYHKQKTYLLTSTILALIIHAQFEAWWVGVGSVQLPLFFVYLGLIVQGLKFSSSRIEVK